MSVKKMRKALKKLSAIKDPSKELNEIIYSLEDLISSEENGTALGEVKEAQEKHILCREALDIVEDKSNSYRRRRSAICDVLELGATLSFDYEKKDGSSRVVNVAWDDDYTYDVPPIESDYINMYDIDDDFFKRFFLDKMSNIVYDLA